MPVIQITTTLSSDELPTDFELNFSEFLAKVLNKDIARITVAINCGARICNGGDTTSKFILMYMHSIARFNVENNPAYTDEIVDYVNKKTNVPANKIQIIYTDLPPFMAGKGK